MVESQVSQSAMFIAASSQTEAKELGGGVDSEKALVPLLCRE